MVRFKLMVRKAKKIMKTTTNRGEYRRARKAYLETKGEINCGYCKPNRGCNARYKRKKKFGGFSDENLRYPSWKDVSKNRKQWMKKPLKFETEQLKWRNSQYVTIYW